MFKWERRLIETIDNKLPAPAFCLITLLAVYMRRAGYWYPGFDFQSHFYPELPTYLHTPLYTYFISILPDISITPLMQVRILVCLFDFIVAFGAVWLLRETRAAYDQTALLACYTMLLISPLTIESGLLWLHMDSVCMSAFLWSLVLYRRRHSLAAGILLGAGAAILPQYAVLFLLPVFCKNDIDPQHRPVTPRCRNVLLPKAASPDSCAPCVFLCAGMLTAIFLNFVSIDVHTGLNLQKGLLLLLNWLVISPENGAAFTGLLPWLKAMPAYFGYMVGTLSLILAFLKPKYRVPAALIHLLLILYIGNILQNGW